MSPTRARFTSGLLLAIYTLTLATSCTPAGNRITEATPGQHADHTEPLVTSNVGDGELRVAQTLSVIAGGQVSAQEMRQANTTNAAIARGELGLRAPLSLPRLDVGGTARTVHQVMESSIGPLEVEVRISRQGTLDHLVARRGGTPVLAIEYAWEDGDAGNVQLTKAIEYYFSDESFAAQRVVDITRSGESTRLGQESVPLLGQRVSAPGWITTTCVESGSSCLANATEEDGSGCCWLQVLGVIGAAAAVGISGTAVLTCIALAVVGTAGAGIMACLAAGGVGGLALGTLSAAVEAYESCVAEHCPSGSSAYARPTWGEETIGGSGPLAYA